MFINRPPSQQHLHVTRHAPRGMPLCLPSKFSAFIHGRRSTRDRGRTRCHPTTHKGRSSRLTTKDVSRRTTSAVSTKESLRACLLISVGHCLPHFTSVLIVVIPHNPRPPHHAICLAAHHARGIVGGHQGRMQSLTLLCACVC